MHISGGSSPKKNRALSWAGLGQSVYVGISAARVPKNQSLAYRAFGYPTQH